MKGSARTSKHHSKRTGRGEVNQTVSGLAPIVRPHIADVIRDCLECGRIVILCAPRGMGKSMIVTHEVDEARRRGSVVTTLAFSGQSCQQVLRRLVGLEREVVTGEQEPLARLVILEDLPDGDEKYCATVAAWLNNFARKSVGVLITIEPEAIAVSEGVANAEVMQTPRLLVSPHEMRRWDPAFGDVSPSVMERLTHGIPMLVDALRPVAASVGLSMPGGLGHAYPKAVECLAANALAVSLMDEERSLRMGMLLLDHGSYASLEALGIRVDPLLLEEIGHGAPFFGIDPKAYSFACVSSISGSHDMAYESIRRNDVGLLERAVDHLSSRGDFRPAGYLAESYLSPVECARFVSRYPLELVNAGRVALVRRAADTMVGETSNTDEGRGLLVARTALACLDGDDDAIEAGVAAIANGGGLEDVEAEIGLLAYDRRLRQALPHAWPDDIVTRIALLASDATVGTGTLPSALWVHARARTLMLEGHSHEAFRLLVVSGVPCDGASLAGALLADDFAIARTLTGDPAGPADERAMEDARAFFESAGLREQVLDEAQATSALGVLVGGADEFAGIDKAVARAVRRHDRLYQALLLNVASIADLRRDAGKRAHVRAHAAQELAHVCGSRYVERVAALLSVLAQMRLGEIPDIPAIEADSKEGSDDALGILVRMACAASRHDEKILKRLGTWAAEVPCDPELLVLLDLASIHGGEASERLGSAIPRTWGAPLDVARRRRAIENEPRNRPSRSKSLDIHAKERDAEQLEIDLLGGFTVRLGGILLPSEAWTRRKAAVILAMLAASKKHACRRFAIVEALWPEDDYMRGRSCLYSTLSSLRKTLGQSGDDEERYILGGGGLIQLNMAHASCDVDRFETKARHTLMHEGDAEWMLGQCREIEEMYRGDLFLPAFDASGMFQERRSSLRKLYSDAMVAGAEAALSLGMAREALWFARDADEPGVLREDVASCLIKALQGMGRTIEAEDAYARFATRVIDETGLPPSMTLRSLYGGIRTVRDSSVRRRIEQAAIGGRDGAAEQIEVVGG